VEETQIKLGGKGWNHVKAIWMENRWNHDIIYMAYLGEKGGTMKK